MGVVRRITSSFLLKFLTVSDVYLQFVLGFHQRLLLLDDPWDPRKSSRSFFVTCTFGYISFGNLYEVKKHISMKEKYNSCLLTHRLSSFSVFSPKTVFSLTKEEITIPSYFFYCKKKQLYTKRPSAK